MEYLPKVSVVIPTYNSALYLDEAIQSVLDQTYKNYEIIIMDNASTDDTTELVKKYLSDKRIVYIKNETNIGLAGNWNACLTHARGEYIKYLCSDDKFHPELLEKFVAIMEKYPNVALVTSSRQEFGLESHKNILPLHHLQNGKAVIFESLKTHNWLGEPTTVMFRKKNLTAGKFNPEFSYIIDWDMWLRQLTLGDCYIIPETLSYFRVHKNQYTKTALKELLNYFEMYRFYKEAKEQNKYKLDFTQYNIEPFLKKKAAVCAKAIPKILPKLTNRTNWRLLKKAFVIVYKEQVIINSFIEIIKAFNKRLKLFFGKNNKHRSYTVVNP